MLTKQQSDWLDIGIEHFNEGRFWHAHEDWEANLADGIKLFKEKIL